MQTIATIWIGWVVFAGAFVLGLGLSYVTYKRKRVLAFIVGIGTGATLAMVL